MVASAINCRRAGFALTSMRVTGGGYRQREGCAPCGTDRRSGRMGDSPALVWHTYPLGLLGADQTGSDRTCSATLRELAAWLPHVASLGADTLLLGPIFKSLSHGYDTVDHRIIDDRLGTDGDFDALLAAASAQDIGVILDGAFAYASRAFWRLTDPTEALEPWFLRDVGGGLVPWRVDTLVTLD